MYANLINPESQISHPDSALRTKHGTCLQSVKTLEAITHTIYTVVDL